MKSSFALMSLALTGLLLSGCEKKDNPPPVPFDYSEGIYIVNEGAFAQNNGSISYLDPEYSFIQHWVFEVANDRVLGDVVQSMSIMNDTLGIIVVNGSSKIELVNLHTFKCLAAPIPVNYPRYFMPVSETKGYLTGGNMQGYVYIFDAVNLEITDSIQVGSGPETMVTYPDYLMVANSGGWGVDSTISVIDMATDQVVDTIHTSKVPVDMVKDATGNLWVYCKGFAEYDPNPPYTMLSETDAVIQKFDPENRDVVLWQATVGKAGDYIALPKIAASPGGDYIYYLRPNGVFRISVSSPEISLTPFISGSFYGMEVNPSDGNIFVFSSASFTTHSTLYIYSPLGVALANSQVGIGGSTAAFHLP
jgi:hypothetical protein